MGLGKTLQTLSLFAYVKASSPKNSVVDPHLIVCPLSVVDTWIRELNHWVPSFRVLRFHAQEAERTRLKLAVRDGEVEFDVCVTTYEGFVAEDTWLKSRKWTYVVLDEGHKIKNRETQIAKSVQGIGSLYRLILTGTPVQNNLVELWGLFHWLYPAVFTQSTEKMFHEAFNLTLGTYALPFLKATEKLLSKLMLRRTKDGVEGQICVPPKEELTVFIPMSEAQRFWTYRLLTKLDTPDLEGIFAGEGKGEGRVVEGVHVSEGQKTSGEGNSRKSCAGFVIFDGLTCYPDRVEAFDEPSHAAAQSVQSVRFSHFALIACSPRFSCRCGFDEPGVLIPSLVPSPYLLPDVEPDPYTLGQHVVASSSKLILIDKLLKTILPSGERVLIFSVRPPPLARANMDN